MPAWRNWIAQVTSNDEDEGSNPSVGTKHIRRIGVVVTFLTVDQKTRVQFSYTPPYIKLGFNMKSFHVGDKVVINKEISRIDYSTNSHEPYAFVGDKGTILRIFKTVTKSTSAIHALVELDEINTVGNKKVTVRLTSINRY